MKIKDRNTINTSQYSFIRTAHEKKKKILFDLILYVRWIIYLDLLRCLFDLADIQERCLWKNHHKVQVFLKGFCWICTMWTIPTNEYILKLGEHWLGDQWGGGAQAGLHELVEVLEEKGKCISLYV